MLQRLLEILEHMEATMSILRKPCELLTDNDWEIIRVMRNINTI